jgi:hypothetical protein
MQEGSIAIFQGMGKGKLGGDMETEWKPYLPHASECCTGSRGKI